MMQPYYGGSEVRGLNKALFHTTSTTTINYFTYSQVFTVQPRREGTPTLPPKKYALRHTTSQPNIIEQAPPRPVASKPSIRPSVYPQCYGLYKDRHGHSRSGSRTRSSEPRPHKEEENQYEDITRSDGTRHSSRHRPRSSTGVAYSEANQLMGNKAGLSASSNEIFKLYQTRDCLGNVLYEL
uniref:Uncharacterized protein n=1 Tax=Ditylenchus dipsaci TaxID=166011 RepID=A0A915DZW6_9BILA